MLALVRCSLGCALVRTEGPGYTHAVVLYSTSTPPILHLAPLCTMHYAECYID